MLLIEDDGLVRETYEEALRSKGHLVTAVPTGKDGLSAFGAHGFDLVITDLSMPGMSGLELAQQVKQIDPAVRIILISGWGNPDEEEVARAGIDHVLSKPCLLQELVSAVEQVLRGPTSDAAPVSHPRS